MRLSFGFMVFRPNTSRYPTIEISASADGMTTKVWIFWPMSGTRNAASRPVIDRSYPMEDVIEACRYVETEQKTGNVVLTIGRA